MPLSATQTDLLEHLRALEKATVISQPASDTVPRDILEDAPRALDIVQSISKLEGVTAEDLRATKAGVIINRLTKSNASDELAKAAKELVAKWKAAVLPASSSSSAAASTASSSPSPSPPAKKDSAPEDKDKEKEKKRKLEKEKSDKDGADKKKAKSEPNASDASSSSSAASSSEMGRKYPELTHGVFGLFKTGDSMRDKVQYMLWDALGEPSKKVLDAQEEARKSQAVAVDLSAYKIKSSAATSTTADEAKSEEAKAETTSAPASSPAPAVPTFVAPVHSFHTRVELAHNIEAEMIKKWSDSFNQAYRQKIRDLAPQLKDSKNQDLNDDLYLGTLTAKKVVEASSKDLASAEFKAQRDKEAAYNREAARSDIGNDAGASDMFQCDACKEWNCTYFQMQTRGADEPMTIFCTCLSCGNKFRSGDGER